MENLLSTINTILGCATVLALAIVILLSLPNSRLRDFLMPIVAWCFAIFCGLYCISPVDVLPEVLLGPFGFIDDVGVLVAGIVSARLAMSSSKA